MRPILPVQRQQRWHRCAVHAEQISSQCRVYATCATLDHLRRLGFKKDCLHGIHLRDWKLLENHFIVSAYSLVAAPPADEYRKVKHKVKVARMECAPHTSPVPRVGFYRQSSDIRRVAPPSRAFASETTCHTIALALFTASGSRPRVSWERTPQCDRRLANHKAGCHPSICTMVNWHLLPRAPVSPVVCG